jgi:hypothetical protein
LLGGDEPLVIGHFLDAADFHAVVSVKMRTIDFGLVLVW